VTIRVGDPIPVSVNTTAVVARNLVTGLARIDLVTPGTPGPPLREVPEGEEYPVIAEGSSGLDQIADAFGRVAATGESALSNLEDLLSEGNREQIIGTVEAVRALVTGLEQRLSRLDSLADGIEQTTHAFRDTAIAFQSTARTLEQTGREASGVVANVAKQVGPLSDQARATLGALASAARTIERESGGIIERLETSADAGGIELRLTARELRGSAEALARAAERLRDPGAALLGPSTSQLGPGEGS
jgi:phospholipid/cholesterol/gamma-HCH transport system substrate-binding protein